MGREGFEPPKANATWFTATPVWPLRNLPKLIFYFLISKSKQKNKHYPDIQTLSHTSFLLQAKNKHYPDIQTPSHTSFPVCASGGNRRGGSPSPLGLFAFNFFKLFLLIAEKFLFSFAFRRGFSSRPSTTNFRFAQICASGGNRTPDAWLFRPTLYH